MTPAPMLSAAPVLPGKLSRQQPQQPDRTLCDNNMLVARPERFELPTLRFEVWSQPSIGMRSATSVSRILPANRGSVSTSALVQLFSNQMSFQLPELIPQQRQDIACNHWKLALPPLSRRRFWLPHDVYRRLIAAPLRERRRGLVSRRQRAESILPTS